MHQHVSLQMLVEQELAEVIPNGFIVPTSTVLSLDHHYRSLLQLPDLWSGRIAVDFRGLTKDDSFNVTLKCSTASGRLTSGFKLEGPTIRFSEQELHLLTGVQHAVFEAVTAHGRSRRSEQDNLELVHVLQQASDYGADIELGHFKRLPIIKPESISLRAELDDNGDLHLSPMMGQAADFHRTQRVINQIRESGAKSVRVDDEIILLDEARLKGVQEILNSRVIPKKMTKEFLKNPTAFIDASLVDLENGFSLRVKGVTGFRQAYFGETEESGLDWFGKDSTAVQELLPEAMKAVLKDSEDLRRFRELLDDAIRTGSDEVFFDGKVIDVSDNDQVMVELNRIQKSFEEPTEPITDDPEPKDSDQEIAVLDIELNDENQPEFSRSVQAGLASVLCPEDELDWSNYKRSPFPHQITGVRWILGLMNHGEGQRGGLLADDMGLGKTFMALASIEHLYRKTRDSGETCKPCLVVAPLSLLREWEEEVTKTFRKSPFKDIVLLQANGDLRKFTLTGRGSELKAQDLQSQSVFSVKYSLKTGGEYDLDRLDVPERLVITTYQTLRDYQFSLGSIEWAMVILDEAQNTKNPNALQTRAAKGLNTDFMLLATGTPVENSLADFWCLVDTARPGYLGSYQEFRSTYISPLLQAAGDEVDQVRDQIGRQLRETVGSLMLRRLKEDNLDGLPKKLEFAGIEDVHSRFLPDLKSTMEGDQLDVYNKVVQSVGVDGKRDALSALHKLRDVSLHPGLIAGDRASRSIEDLEPDAFVEGSGKVTSLVRTLEEIRGRGEKCIIFVVNRRLQSTLSVALSAKFSLPLIPVINGTTKAVSKSASSTTRKSMINDFECSTGFNILIMSPIAAGVGLTIVAANNVIHLERHWNPAKEAQATDRVYRIGQTKQVNVYRPVLHHPSLESFDVNLHELLSRKSMLKDAVVTPEQVIPTPEGFTDRDWSNTKVILGEDLGVLDWKEFEALCAEVFSREFGADNCWLTAKGSDYGADVVLEAGVRSSLIQCKHTKSSRYDGYSAVQQVFASKVKYGEARGIEFNRLIVATSAIHLSKRTRDLAKQYSVEIYDGKRLSRLLEVHQVRLLDVLRRQGKQRLQV